MNCCFIEDMKVILKPDFIIHDIAGEKVLIGAGEQVDFSKMLMLNDTAACIITALQKQPATVEELAGLLVEGCEVPLQEAYADVEVLLDKLVRLGVVIVGV